METKKIIERNLPLNQKYILINTNYISLIDGFGCTCDNCGKLIANIATIKAETTGTTHSVGFDCLENFLINNQLLDGNGVEKYTQIIKKALPKIKKIREDIKGFLSKNTFIDEVKIVKQNFLDGWITFNFYQQGKQRWNDNTKYKVMDFEMLLASLSTIKNVKFELIEE